MNLVEIQKSVRNVKKRFYKKFNHPNLGILKSNLRGSGMEFKDHKPYSHGDDIRFIDWKILAKTTVPYVRTFENERNLDILVLIDMALSMMMGYKEISKLQVALELTYLIYFLSKDTKYKVQTVLIGDRILKTPKCDGDKGIISLISLLRNTGIIDDEGMIRRGYRAKEELLPVIKHKEFLKLGVKRKHIFIFSDFNNLFPEEGLNKLSRDRNVSCVKIISPLECMKFLPFSIMGHKSHELDRHRKYSVNSLHPIKEDPTKILPSRLKTINVMDDYLKEFINEMLK